MALGAWICGERSRRLARPLMAYAAVEAVLGICAMFFDPAFRALQSWVFDQAIPALPSPATIDALKWGLAALSILPQSMLLGATFPLMSAGVVRLQPAAPGSALGWLYFCNSLGAAAGVLASGFYLVGAVGLAGAMLVAGVANFLLAAAVWGLARDLEGAQGAPAAPSGSVILGARGSIMLAAAFLTGAASFLYEIGWIRMLSLVLGAATHSFELMLSAFILGLALGSFHVRDRIDAYADPVRALAWIQLAMGGLALGTLVLYGQSFDWMGFVLASVQRNDGGYVLFNLAANGICLALMLPVTFFAGMTLPLITAILLRAGAGEAAIGRVYAANTLGAIVGVLIAVHAVMPLLGLKAVIVTGAAIDMGLGAWLLLRGSAPLTRRSGAALAALGCAAIAIVAFVELEPARLASGVFRIGTARSPNEVVFHRDGKTASVDVTRNPQTGALALLTNGKVDASLSAKATSPDDYTMVLSAALPMLLHPEAQSIAVVGMGSGRTTHAFLHARSVRHVDTVEIEQAVVDAARLFGKPVGRAFTDPRGHIHIEDAKTFFSRHAKRYDVIMSEPSNPWVSGVASLFSSEFYRQVRRYIAPGGLFVQWLQLYEFDLALLASVLEALGPEFADYAIYATNSGDILIVASPEGTVPAIAAGGLAETGLQELLREIDVRTRADVAVRRIGGKAELSAFVTGVGSPANSDYRPFVDQNAVKRRFMRSDATAFGQLGAINRRIAPRAPPLGAVTPSVHYAPQERAAQARVIADYFAWQAGRGEAPRGTVHNSLLDLVVTLRALHSQCEALTLQAALVPAMRRFADATLADLDEHAVAAIVADLRGARCYAGAPAEVKSWIAFFEAAGLRRDAAVIEHGQALVRHARDAREKAPETVGIEMLAAELRSGARTSAVAADDFPDTLALRYLRGRQREALLGGRKQ